MHHWRDIVKAEELAMSSGNIRQEVGMDIKLRSATSAASTSVKVNAYGCKEQFLVPSTPLDNLDTAHAVSNFL